MIMGRKYLMAISPVNSGDDITVLNRNGTVVMKLDSLKSTVPVEPGDVPGRIKNIVTYVYVERDPPMMNITKVYLYSLIWAQLEIDGNM